MVVGPQLSVFGGACGGCEHSYLPQAALNRQPTTDT